MQHPKTGQLQKEKKIAKYEKNENEETFTETWKAGDWSLGVYFGVAVVDTFTVDYRIRGGLPFRKLHNVGLTESEV